MSEVKRAEFKVREVTRYQVTRYIEGEGQSTSSQHGEYDNYDTAYEVCRALANDYHSRTGFLPGDERIKYPEYVHQGSGAILPKKD